MARTCHRTARRFVSFTFSLGETARFDEMSPRPLLQTIDAVEAHFVATYFPDSNRIGRIRQRKSLSPLKLRETREYYVAVEAVGPAAISIDGIAVLSCRLGTRENNFGICCCPHPTLSQRERGFEDEVIFPAFISHLLYPIA